jgi:hypothetical protein
MTPTPEQLAQLTNDAKLAYFNDGTIGISHKPIEAYVSGYLRARTEQATEIAALKALAKFGAMVLGSRILMFQPSSVTSHALKAGVLVSGNGNLQAVSYAPNIEATIEQLLKD